MNYIRQPYTFDRVVRICFTVIVLVGVYFLLVLLKGALLPFFVACLIAYMLEPMVKWNMKWMHVRHRFLPVVMTLLEVCVVLGVATAIVVPYFISETASMADSVKKYYEHQIQIPYISQSIHQWIKENIDMQYVSRLLSRQEWGDLIKQAISSGWSFLSSGVAFIVGVISWLVVILYVIFIMIDYERLMLSFRQLVPQQHRRPVYRIATDIKNAMNRYFRGQFLIAMSVGVLFAIGFYLVGLPMGIVFGLFVGVLNMVPYLQLISLPIAAILCLVATVSGGHDFWVIFWETMAVYVVVQLIQDTILTPKIMGKAMGLNPAIILLALSIWGSLLGFLGLIIALPLTTLLLSYYNYYVVDRVDRANIERLEQNPIDSDT